MQYFIAPSWMPVLPPPPPPPPPPRHKRQLSGQSQSSAVGVFDVTPAAPEMMSDQHFTVATRDGQTETSCSQGCTSCRELRLVVLGLEQKLTTEIARIQQDAQREQELLTTEINKKWKGLESTSWKHVGELKDQNRHLRQRNYELEVQNGHLNRHIMLLQTQYQLVLKASQDRAALLSATLADSNMRKVPHTGADIW